MSALLWWSAALTSGLLAAGKEEARCTIHFCSGVCSRSTFIGSSSSEGVLAETPEETKTLHVIGPSCRLVAFEHAGGVGKFKKFEAGIVLASSLAAAFETPFGSYEIWHAEDNFEGAHIRRIYGYIIAKTYERLKLQAGNQGNVHSMLGGLDI
jgi:hypothetical protein